MQLSLEWVQFQPLGGLLEKAPLLRKLGFVVQFSPSTDWMRPTHIVEGSLLYLKFIHLIVKGKGGDEAGEDLCRTIASCAQLTG